MPPADDTIKCNLKPLNRADYAPAVFTDDQWAQMVKTYPQGVCDWSQPGVDRVPTVPWLSYQDANGNVVYGGRPLGDVPTSARAATLGLPAARSCISRRSFQIRVRAPRGQRLRSAQVFVNGKRVRASRRGRRAVGSVNLRGLPAGTVHVRVVARTSSGHRMVLRRTYRTCAAKKQKAKRKHKSKRKRASRR
jgi:hypothetical protein